MTRITRWTSAVALGAVGLLAVGCGPRVIIATGTTLGLKATPGDPQAGRSPQLTLGYKRAETSLVPTGRNKADRDSDAYSTLAAFSLSTQWGGNTTLSSFISSGLAARALATSDAQAPEAARAKALAPAPAGQPGNSFVTGFLNGLQKGE